MVGVWLNDFHNELADKDIFPDVYDGDFYENIPYENYLSFDEPFESNLSVFDIRSYGADPQATATHNRAAINAAVDACFAGGGGIVRVDGGEDVTGSVRLKSNTTFKIAGGSALIAIAKQRRLIAVVYSTRKRENITITVPGKVLG
jgi:polygalacturonase